jgi:hypothetical protein
VRRWLFVSVVLAFPMVAALAQGVKPRTLAVEVAFADGRSTTVRDAKVVQCTNPGYVPSRYAPTSLIEFRRSTSSLGATTTDRKTLDLGRIRRIDYRKNKLNWCFSAVSLSDGTTLALMEGRTPFTLAGPESILPFLSDENRRELGLLRLSSEFDGYQARAGGDTDIQLEGSVGSGRFGFASADLLTCPSVDDGPTFVDVKALTFLWRQ